MAAGSGMLTRKAHVSHQIATRSLAHLILAARLMVGLAVCIRDQVWLGTPGHEFEFQALLEGERGAPPEGIPVHQRVASQAMRSSAEPCNAAPLAVTQHANV